MRALVIAVVAGCYQPVPGLDGPCATNGACPSGLSCSAAHTCVASDAASPHDDGPRGDGPASDVPTDRPIDAPVETLPWSDITLVGLATDGALDDPSLDAGELQLFFNRNDATIFVATRAAITDPWGAPHIVTELDTASSETTPELSMDGLTIYFASNRGGGNGLDIYVATRATATGTFAAPAPINELESAAADDAPATTSAQLDMVMTSARAGGRDQLFETSRASTLAVWDVPVQIAELASTGADGSAFLTEDRSTLYFGSSRTGQSLVYITHRANPQAAWAAPATFAELEPGDSSDPWVSPDGHRMYFSSSRSGQKKIYMASR